MICLHEPQEQVAGSRKRKHQLKQQREVISKDVSMNIVASGDVAKIAELVEHLHAERDIAISQVEVVRKTAKNTSRQKLYHMKRAADLRAQLVVTQLEKRQLEFGIVKFNKRRKEDAKKFVCTLPGGYRLALSRNLGHAGSLAALQSAECDSTRHVCVRWEMLLSNSFQAGHAAWHGNAALSIDQAVEASSQNHHQDDHDGVVALELHGVSGDASNASVLQSKKTHVCRVHSVYAVHTSTDQTQADGTQSMHWLKWCRVQFSDVQLLPESLGFRFQFFAVCVCGTLRSFMGSHIMPFHTLIQIQQK